MVTLSTAHPIVSSSKRSRSSDSQRSASTTPVPVALRSVDDSTDASLPAFLRQSNVEIMVKFQDLQRQHNDRVRHGYLNIESSSPWLFEETRDAMERNRYRDIKVWRNSRIHLKVPEGTCDYINASPISTLCSTSGVETKYIAAQGPKQTGVNDFWHMIWHETSQVAVIVMLTQLNEGTSEKCFQYYPGHPDDDYVDLAFPDGSPEGRKGHVELVEMTFDEVAKTTIRKLLLKYGEETKTVWHFLYEDWTDHRAPKHADCSSLLELVKLSKLKSETLENPRIIHCSAGIGRSGTFIALEHLLNELQVGAVTKTKESEDLIFDTVNKLREQRMLMVQSIDQYQFLYNFLRHEYQKQKEWQLALDASSKVDLVITEEIFAIPEGEPIPKARKLSRGLKAYFLRDKTNSAPLTEDGRRLGEGKAPDTI